MYLKLLSLIDHNAEISDGALWREYLDYTLIPILHTYNLGKSFLLFAFASIPKARDLKCVYEAAHFSILKY